jgi:hypothetical protein
MKNGSLSMATANCDVASHKSDEGQNLGVHLMEDNGELSMATAKRASLDGKTNLGTAKKNADGSMPPILVLELVSDASTTFVPKH